MTLKFKSGLTLTELIVAVILIGIVMLAVTSLDLAMRQTHQTTSKDAEVSMQIAAAMLHITNNVAISPGMRTDPGIIVNAASMPLNLYLFARHDGGDASTYADDTWVRYNHTIATRNISFCASLPTPTQISCDVPEYTLIDVESFSVDFTPNEVTRNIYLTVTISSLYDNSQAFDLLDNPRAILSSKIIPLQHTW